MEPLWSFKVFHLPERITSPCVSSTVSLLIWCLLPWHWGEQFYICYSHVFELFYWTLPLRSLSKCSWLVVHMLELMFVDVLWCIFLLYELEKNIPYRAGLVQHSFPKTLATGFSSQTFRVILKDEGMLRLGKHGPVLTFLRRLAAINFKIPYFFLKWYMFSV